MEGGKRSVKIRNGVMCIQFKDFFEFFFFFKGLRNEKSLGLKYFSLRFVKEQGFLGFEKQCQLEDIFPQKDLNVIA